MSDASRSYDEVPYPIWPHWATHPARLAVIATLFGLRPAPASRARVLEIGCAGGGNLVPCALAFPESTFLGIDRSPLQVDFATWQAAQLGLRNIAFETLDLLEVGPDLGEFDYIIVHGVYSWVPRPVQEKILEICKKNLAPNGVAYVSYNTYPGWFMKRNVREMMSFFTRDLAEPQARVAAARKVMEAIAGGAQGLVANKNMNVLYAVVLGEELRLIGREQDSYLYHEYLEPDNEPIFFHEFYSRATRHGLQYVTDSGAPIPRPIPEAVLGATGASDVGATEQLRDFLTNGVFRKSLLCHEAAPVARDLASVSLRGMHIAAPEGSGLDVEPSIGKAALAELTRAWPRSVPFEALLAAVRAETGGGEEVEFLLTALILATYGRNSAALYLDPPQLTNEVSARPVASPLARLQAKHFTVLTDLRHNTVTLPEKTATEVLQNLDGTRDRAALLALLADLARRGVLVPKEGAADAPFFEATLDRLLSGFAKSALLLA